MAHSAAPLLLAAPSALLFWVLGSALVYILSSQGLWWLRTTPLGRTITRRWPAEVGRFLFFLGVPYLALGGWPLPPLHGLLSPADLGLVGLDARWPVIRWLEAAGTGLGLGLLTALILALAWTQARSLRFPPRPWWALLVDGLCLEGHWAFYRGALALLLGSVYWGVFLGLGLVYLEWGLSPWWRQGWRAPGAAGGQWLRAALALVTALLFLLTHNLWVCLGVHWLVEQAFWGALKEPCSRAEVKL